MILKDFFLYVVIVAVGVLAGLLIWTLIVKNKIQAQITADTASNPVLSVLSNL